MGSARDRAVVSMLACGIWAAVVRELCGTSPRSTGSLHRNPPSTAVWAAALDVAREYHERTRDTFIGQRIDETADEELACYAQITCREDQGQALADVWHAVAECGPWVQLKSQSGLLIRHELNGMPRALYRLAQCALSGSEPLAHNLAANLIRAVKQASSKKSREEQ